MIVGMLDTLLPSHGLVLLVNSRNYDTLCAVASLHLDQLRLLVHALPLCNVACVGRFCDGYTR